MEQDIKLSNTLLLIWPLLIGITMIMIGNGLQGTLLGLRATSEGFNSTTIGIVMSLYLSLNFFFSIIIV